MANVVYPEHTDPTATYVDPATGKLEVKSPATTASPTTPASVPGVTITPTDLNTNAQKFDAGGNPISPYGRGSALSAATGSSTLPDVPLTDPGALGQYGAQVNTPGVPISKTADNISALGGSLGVGTKSPYVSPEATVAHQLDILLNKDSPYMRVAAAKSKAEAEGKGLLSSSMAVGAGRKAAIETALPIATADAGTYATSDINRQTQVMQSALQAQGAAEAKDLSTQQFGQQGALEQAKAYDNLKALKTQGAINFEIEKMGQEATDRRLGTELDAKMWINDQNISADLQKIYTDAITQRSNQNSANLANILTNPNFKTEDDMQEAIRISDEQYRSDISFITSSVGAGVDWTNIGAPDTGATTTTPNEVTSQDGTPVTLEGAAARGKDRVIDESAGTAYEPLASVSYTDPIKFSEDLKASGVTSSPEFMDFREDAFPITFGPLVDADQQTEVYFKPYSSLMFAVLNPENADAQVNAQFALRDQTTGYPKVPYQDTSKLTASQKAEVPLYQNWINDVMYGGVPPVGWNEDPITHKFYPDPSKRVTL